MDGVQTQQYFVSSAQIITSIVIPTIVFCIGLVIAMLIGINKCKQWELDKIVELRRTRRLIQRITERLRETNFKTIEKAKHLRKRAVDRKKGNGQQQHKIHPTNRNGNPQRRHQQQQVLWKYDETGTFTAPPSYRSSLAKASLTESPMESSPPPPYEDSLLDELYYECMKPRRIDEDDDEYD